MTRGPSTRRLIFTLALAFGTFAAAPSGAANFYVGTGTGCTHANASLAVAAAAANGPDLDILRIASPSLFLGSLVEVDDLFLVDAGTTAIARNAAIIGNLATMSGGGVWEGVGGTSFTVDVDPATCSIGRG